MTSQRDAGEAKSPDEQPITVDEILEVVGRIMELDERRQKTFQDEVEADADRFVETREVVRAEKERLDRLDEYLAAESEHLSDLVDGTDHLSTEQAVRNRDQSIEKIREHNRALAKFRAEMDALLEVIETNLDRIEAEGVDADIEDSQEHLEAAIAALRDHNDCIEGLEKNLRILHAYLR